MANGATVHVPVGIPLMTDAALVRTLFEFKQQLSGLSSGAPEIPQEVQGQIASTIGEIEAELRDREIDPDGIDLVSSIPFGSANVVRFISLGGES